MATTKCIECKGHKPSYLNYYCEECWKQALKQKLEEEDNTWMKPIKKESK